MLDPANQSRLEVTLIIFSYIVGAVILIALINVMRKGRVGGYLRSEKAIAIYTRLARTLRIINFIGLLVMVLIFFRAISHASSSWADSLFLVSAGPIFLVYFMPVIILIYFALFSKKVRTSAINPTSSLALQVIALCCIIFLSKSAYHFFQ